MFSGRKAPWATDALKSPGTVAPPPLQRQRAAPRSARAQQPRRRPAHLLPAGSRTPGRQRLAGPAPTAGPCPRLRRSSARPVTLARRPTPRRGTPPRPATTRRRPGPGRGFPSTLSATGRRHRHQEFPCAQSGEETLKQSRPARLRLRPPFCTAGEDAARDGGHFRALGTAGGADSTHLHQELSSCRRSCLLRIRSSGTGKGGKRGTENKKGGGRGRKESRTTCNSAQRSRCCNHHPVPTATSIELQLAAGAEACLKPNLSLWGSRTHQSRPEWLPHYPIGSLDVAHHQSPARSGAEPHGKFGCGAAPPQCAKPYSRRLWDQASGVRGTERCRAAAACVGRRASGVCAAVPASSSCTGSLFPGVPFPFTSSFLSSSVLPREHGKKTHLSSAFTQLRPVPGQSTDFRAPQGPVVASHGPGLPGTGVPGGAWRPRGAARGLAARLQVLGFGSFWGTRESGEGTRRAPRAKRKRSTHRVTLRRVSEEGTEGRGLLSPSPARSSFPQRNVWPAVAEERPEPARLL